MNSKTLNALGEAMAPPPKGGTPNRIGQLEAEIQQGIKELEGMLK